MRQLISNIPRAHGNTSPLLGRSGIPGKTHDFPEAGLQSFPRKGQKPAGDREPELCRAQVHGTQEWRNLAGIKTGG